MEEQIHIPTKYLLTDITLITPPGRMVVLEVNHDYDYHIRPVVALQGVTRHTYTKPATVKVYNSNGEQKKLIIDHDRDECVYATHAELVKADYELVKSVYVAEPMIIDPDNNHIRRLHDYLEEDWDNFNTINTYQLVNCTWPESEDETRLKPLAHKLWEQCAEELGIDLDDDSSEDNADD